MRRRVRVAVTLAMLAAVALLMGGPSAIAQPARQRVNIAFPGLNHFYAKRQPPPEPTLLRFYMLEHTYSYPRTFNGLICLHKFNRTGSKSPRVFRCARVGFADLASPRSGVTWHIGEPPYSTWDCAPGRYFVSFGLHAISSSGAHMASLWFSPFHAGSRVGGLYGQDWGTEPPTRREAHRQANCR